MTTPDPQELRTDIARTRDELGDTVEALAARTDVKARAKEQAGAAAQAVSDKVGAAAGAVRESVRDVHLPATARRPLPLAAVGVAAVLVAVLVVVVRRRRS